MISNPLQSTEGLTATYVYISAVFGALALALITSAIIILFIKDKKKWSKIYMWATIILCFLGALGHI